MGITSVLPNTPTPATLALVAGILLVAIVIGRLFGWKGAEARCKAHYKFALIVTTTLLAIGFAAVAFANILETPNGSIIALVGSIVLAVLTAMMAFQLLIGAGSFFRGRLPMALMMLLALTMYVAVVCYTQTVSSKAAGSLAGSTWGSMYKVALVVADVLSIIIVPYLALLLVIWLIMVPIKAHRRRRAARAAATGTP